jgi:NADPH:quinone reductase-like Zn-dependent oxidoreductase
MEDPTSSATKKSPIPSPTRAKPWYGYAPARSIISISGSAAAWSACRSRFRISPAQTSPGEVISTPAGEFGAGRRVMVQPGLSCARCAACLDGRDNECAKYDVLGYRSDGGYAEMIRVPVQNLIAIPDSIGFVEAAAFPLAFLTAWHMLITRARLHAGEDVLVLGAGSGVGQAAIQIAWRNGARVFATAARTRSWPRRVSSGRTK